MNSESRWREGRGEIWVLPLAALICSICCGPGRAGTDAGRDTAGATDAPLVDAPGPSDATDTALFRTPNGPELKGDTVLARVFASIDVYAQVRWLAIARDGSFLLGCNMNAPLTAVFYGSQPRLTSLNYDFVVNVDRQGNVIWATGFAAGGQVGPPALLPDGAIIVAAKSGSVALQHSWVGRIEADGTRTWEQDFGASGPEFGALTASPEGDVILVGSASATADLDPGPGTMFPAKRGPFVMKLSGATGALLSVALPDNPGWSFADSLTMRADGRLVVGGMLSDGTTGVLLTMAADGTTGAQGTWREVYSAPVSWTLVDPYVLVSEPTSTPSLWKFRLHVLAADSGAELYSVTNVDEIGYTGFAAGTSRVAGLREGVNSTNIHWSLDWWNVSGAFEGGLLFPQPPAGTTLLMGEVAVGPTDRIAVGLGFQAPAGVTLDIDPGPGVQMFVTPNDGVQLAIVEVAP